MAGLGSMLSLRFKSFSGISPLKPHQELFWRKTECILKYRNNARTVFVLGPIRCVHHGCQTPKIRPNNCFERSMIGNALNNFTRSRSPPAIAFHFLRTRSCFYSTEQSVRGTQDILVSKEVDSLEDKQPDSKDEKQESKDKKKESMFTGKNAWKLGLLSLGLFGILMSGNLLYMWGAPRRDPDGNEIVDEFTDLPKYQAYIRRSTKEFHFFRKMIQEPSSQKLLPDPLKEPYFQPPYTLVLEMTGVLVHPDWTLNTGWRFKKRPDVHNFLQQIGPPLFEVVIFTREQGFTAFPIIDALDPNGFVSYRLFRDATRYMDGHHVKDLDCLNRDLSKLIVVDCDPKAFQLHPRNAFLLTKWSGNDNDSTLNDLAAFLRTIAISGVEDVRPVLEHYSQFDDPLESFKANQRRIQEDQELASKKAAEKKDQGSFVGSWASSLGRRK